MYSHIFTVQHNYLRIHDDYEIFTMLYYVGTCVVLLEMSVFEKS